MARKQVDKPSLRGMDPTLPFYLAVSVGNIDGSIDELGGDGVEGAFSDEAGALGVLKDLNADHPTLEGYVYRCVPVKRVWRGAVRVSPVKINSFKPQRES